MDDDGGNRRATCTACRARRDIVFDTTELLRNFIAARPRGAIRRGTGTGEIMHTRTGSFCYRHCSGHKI